MVDIISLSYIALKILNVIHPPGNSRRYHNSFGMCQSSIAHPFGFSNSNF